MERTNVERAIRLLEQAVAMQARTEGLIKEAASVLQSELLKANHNGHFSRRSNGAFPHIDHGAFSVRWHGSTCSLGATIPLRLLDRLCRRPNCFVCHENLLQDVWQGARKSHNTVRSTVRRLKRSLESAGMADLAQRIRCQGGGYALFLHKVD
jgi:DNA-binding response OmpR family regulator